MTISDGVPSSVMADRKLARSDRATGRTDIDLPAIRNSAVELCLLPVQPWYSPMTNERARTTANTT